MLEKWPGAFAVTGVGFGGLIIFVYLTYMAYLYNRLDSKSMFTVRKWERFRFHIDYEHQQARQNFLCQIRT
jgi:hypothetical protein